MAKKQSQKPAKSERTEPVPMSTVAVPSSLGEGEVRLYDVRKSALPEVVELPPEALLAEFQFVLVHFPSRRCVVIKGDRGAALAAMKKLGRGEDVEHVLPPKKSRVRARVCVKGSCEDVGNPKLPANKVAFTPVPEGADFEQAMEHVFPAQRLTQLWESAVLATEEITTKDGKVIGDKPNWSARTTALKELTQIMKGRPREKEKKQAAKPVLGIQELRQKLLMSPEYRQAMLEMIRDCEVQAQAMAGKPPPKT